MTGMGVSNSTSSVRDDDPNRGDPTQYLNNRVRHVGWKRKAELLETRAPEVQPTQKIPECSKIPIQRDLTESAGSFEIWKNTRSSKLRKIPESQKILEYSKIPNLPQIRFQSEKPKFLEGIPSVQRHKEIYTALNVPDNQALLRRIDSFNLSKEEFRLLSVAPSTLAGYKTSLSGYLDITRHFGEVSLANEERIWFYIRYQMSRGTMKVNSLESKLRKIAGGEQLILQTSSMKDSAFLNRAKKALRKLRSFENRKVATPIYRDWANVLVQKMLDKGWEQMAAIFSIAWMGALRIGDAVRIIWSKINFDHVTPHVILNFSKTMADSTNFQNLFPEEPFLKILQKFLEKNPDRQKFWITENSFRLQLQNLGHDLTNHSVRRGRLNQMAKDGQSLTEISNFAAHKTVEMTKHYLEEPTMINLEVVQNWRKTRSRTDQLEEEDDDSSEGTPSH